MFNNLDDKAFNKVINAIDIKKFNEGEMII